MSLILEALRKSEAERRRGLAPDVAMELPPTPASRPRSVATWLLPALVMAGLLVLAGWWARREPAVAAPPEPPIEATQAAPLPANPMPAMTPRIEPKPTLPAVASMPAPAVAQPAPAASLPIAPARASDGSPVQVASATRPAPIQPMTTVPGPARPLPQPASDISNDTSMLPPVKLSMLMWDEVPSKRFVILNGQRMAEGDRYDGIAVIAIERAGVVVESNGARARVPLP